MRHDANTLNPRTRVNQAVVADVAKGASVSGSVERRTQKSRIARIAQIHKSKEGSTRCYSRSSLKSIARYWNNNKKSIVLGGAKRVTKLDLKVSAKVETMDRRDYPQAMLELSML